MKSDIPRLMKERGFEAMVVLGGGIDNPVMTYMTGPARLMRSVFAMKRDGTSLLVHNPMERDDAATTGLPCASFAQMGLKGFVEEEKSDVRGEARMICAILERLGVSGKVSFYGNFELSRFLKILEVLKDRAPQIEAAVDEDKSVVDVARMTKDPAEIETMRLVGRKTCEALAIVRDFLFSCKVSGKTLVKPDGALLKLGDLRSTMRIELARRGLAERSGTIISMGRDAAVPHNFGNDEEDVETGKTIVVDVFPGEIGGGYAFDITRTYCVGEIPAEVRKVYDTVFEAQRLSLESLRIDTLARLYQDKVCDFFESKGYRTIRQDDLTEEGYVHGLGHGIGLQVQEGFRLAGPESNVEKIVPGTVFTVEPGLYFPSKGIGVRIEDIVHATPDGNFEILVEFPRELQPVRPV
ncbi:MAG: M24 family metallopeptidase [Candidatus Eisenbacteria bacterium]